MSRLTVRLSLAALVITCCFARPSVHAADAPAAGGLKPGDHVAVVGDSITEQKQYSVFIENYLLMCKPAADLRATQFGWGGETSWGFLGRMDRGFAPFKATVATTCYGMNDGGYSPMNDDKAKKYRDAQTEIVRRMKAGGVRLIVVGSPGAVDTDFFRRDPKDPAKAAEMSAMYNKTLSQLRDIARDVAKEEGVAFANVFDPMIDAMAKAKAKLGKDYHVCGSDGFHPAANGHLVMAYAFLKALGCDGNIGSITVHLAANQAEATDGHKVLSAKDGTVEVESTRYPFCFAGDDKSPNSTRSIVEFSPFNQDLNRFMLVVKSAPAGAGKYKVTWGTATKVFPAEQLAKGINLAAEFMDNPFSGPFAAVEAEVRTQQNFETPLIKDMLQNIGKYKELAPEESDALDRVAAAGIKRDRALQDAAAGAVKPVKHSIKIEAVK